MKILAVCGFGVGSSLILRMSIEKVAQELGVECDVENTDLSSARGMIGNAIFTSAELQEELSNGSKMPVYAIKRYTDLTEVKEVFKQFLAENNK